MLKSNTQCDSIGRWGLWGVISSWGFPHHWDYSPYERDPRELPCPFNHMPLYQKDRCPWTKKWVNVFTYFFHFVFATKCPNSKFLRVHSTKKGSRPELFPYFIFHFKMSNNGHFYSWFNFFNVNHFQMFSFIFTLTYLSHIFHWHLSSLFKC